MRTDHPGKGRCWLHGGRGGAPIKTGIYAKAYREKNRAAFLAACTMPNQKDLAGEIAVLRHLLGRLIGMLPEGRTATDQASLIFMTEDIRKLADAIGKNVERKVKIEEGIQIKFEVTFNFKFIHAVIIAVDDYISKAIKNDHDRTKFRNGVAKQLEAVAESFSGATAAEAQSLLPAGI